MRTAIISDTTRTITIERNVFGEEQPGWFIVTNCPVDGFDIWSMSFETRVEAMNYLNTSLSDI